MQAVAEGLRKPIYGVPGSVRSARKNRAGCGPGGRSLALSYPRNSRILNSIWLSKLLRRDVFQGRSIGSSSIYILVYFPLTMYGLTNVKGDHGLESRMG